LTAHLTNVDLSGLMLAGGAERMRVNLGRPRGSVTVGVMGGVSQLRIDRPQGVPLRLRLTGGAGHVEFDRQRLDGVAGSTTLESPGAADADDVFLVEITGGASRIAVQEAGSGER